MVQRSRLISTGACVALAAGGLAFTAPAQAADIGHPTSFVVLQHGHGTQRAAEAVKAAGGTVLQEWPQIGVVIAESVDDTFDDRVREMRGISGAGPTRALAAYQKPSEIVPDGKVQGLGPGTTGGDDALEALNANQWDMRMIGADKAHRRTDGSRDITVGVLDTGVEADHPDLAANIDASQSTSCATRGGVPDSSVAAWQPTTSTHGTHVAGTIAAARNAIGIVGVAPNVRIASVKVTDDAGFIYPEYAICGFLWAADKGMEVTNNSYFIDPYYLWCRSDPGERAVISAVERALKYTERKNVVNVAALGNSGWDLSKPITDKESPDNGTPVVRNYDHSCYDIPAQLNNVVGVSSVGPTSVKSYYSNYGRSETDVAAPGGDARVEANTPDKNGRILSTVMDGKWGYLQGTSMASPHAAGVMALLRSTHPWMPGRVAAMKLNHEADRLSCPSFYDANKDGKDDATCEGGESGEGYYGHGMVDAADAVR